MQNAQMTNAPHRKPQKIVDAPTAFKKMETASKLSARKIYFTYFKELINKLPAKWAERKEYAKAKSNVSALRMTENLSEEETAHLYETHAQALAQRGNHKYAKLLFSSAADLLSGVKASQLYTSAAREALIAGQVQRALEFDDQAQHLIFESSMKERFPQMINHKLEFAERYVQLCAKPGSGLTNEEFASLNAKAEEYIIDSLNMVDRYRVKVTKTRLKAVVENMIKAAESYKEWRTDLLKRRIFSNERLIHMLDIVDKRLYKMAFEIVERFGVKITDEKLLKRLNGEQKEQYKAAVVLAARSDGMKKGLKLRAKAALKKIEEEHRKQMEAQRKRLLAAVPKKILFDDSSGRIERPGGDGIVDETAVGQA
ncbi:hypothetical protein FJZ26_02860 [Candidatus Parvarchaeota archaeon]|nr:hypothetical protein [Candidatus Parvarchaeota archaeon]